LDDNASITLQTDAFDFEIGGYLFQTVDGLLQVTMCISKALVGAQLRWSVREKECYATFYCLKVLEDMSKHIPFLLKQTTKILCTSSQKEHQQVPDKLSRLVPNPEETEASADTDTAILSLAVAQVAISD